MEKKLGKSGVIGVQVSILHHKKIHKNVMYEIHTFSKKIHKYPNNQKNILAKNIWLNQLTLIIAVYVDWFRTKKMPLMT